MGHVSRWILPVDGEPVVVATKGRGEVLCYFRNHGTLIVTIEEPRGKLALGIICNNCKTLPTRPFWKIADLRCLAHSERAGQRLVLEDADSGIRVICDAVRVLDPEDFSSWMHRSQLANPYDS
jgi:hypothetical protein